MIGQNNTGTTRTKKRTFSPNLLSPTLVGNYAMSTSRTNGYYNLNSNVLCTYVGHPFSSSQYGSTIGSATVYVYNITQRKVQVARIPLRLLVFIGNSVFFTMGHSVASKNRWDNLGLTMPSSGDSMALACVMHLDGTRPVGAWKQTWTAS